jgi:hypothetical protein
MARDRNEPIGLLTGKDNYALFTMMMTMMMKRKEIIALAVKIVTNTKTKRKNAEFLEVSVPLNLYRRSTDCFI